MKNYYDSIERELYCKSYSDFFGYGRYDELTYFSNKGKRLFWRALYNAYNYSTSNEWLLRRIWDNKYELFDNMYPYPEDLFSKKTKPDNFALVVEAFYNEDIEIADCFPSKLIQEIVNAHYRFLHQPKKKKSTDDKLMLSFDEAQIFLKKINVSFSELKKGVIPEEFWKSKDKEILVILKNWIFGDDTILTYRLSQLSSAYQNGTLTEKEAICFYKGITLYGNAFNIGMEPQKFWSMPDELLGKAFLSDLYLPCTKDFCDRISVLKDMYNNKSLNASDVLSEFKRLLFLKDSFYITDQAEKRAMAYAQKILKEAKEYADEVGQKTLKDAKEFTLEIQEKTLERAAQEARRLIHMTTFVDGLCGGKVAHIKGEKRDLTWDEAQRIGENRRLLQTLEEREIQAELYKIAKADYELHHNTPYEWYLYG